MISFTEFLVESTDKLQFDKLDHLEHLEDHMFSGNEGVSHAAMQLEDLHNFLTGEKSKTKFTTKYDGSPSVVFGIHPDTKKFFVGTKAVFNKTPKVNYSNEDIDFNHGHSSGLAKALKECLKHLPKIMPSKDIGGSHGVYQGDLMYGKHINENVNEDVTPETASYSFQPNLIKYSVPAHSETGNKIKNAKIGIVIHTQYKGKNLHDMKAHTPVKQSQFLQHSDVHLIDPTIKDNSKSNYTEHMQNEFKNHIDNGTSIYKGMKPETLGDIDKHSKHLKTYINSTIKSNTKPDTQGYINHLTNKKTGDLEKSKSSGGKDKTASKYNELIKDTQKRSDEFDKMFELHHHVQKAKNILIRALKNPTDFTHTVDDKFVKPEGFVAVSNGIPSKLVHRQQFSKLNFDKNKDIREQRILNG